MHVKHKFLMILLSAAIALPSLPASAQEEEEISDARKALGVGILTVFMTTLGAMTSMRKNEQRKIDRLKQDIKEMREIAALDGYLDGATHELQDALVLGDEQALRDLAEILSVPEVHFDTWRDQVLSRRVALFEALSEPEPHAMLHHTYHLLQLHTAEVPASPCVQVNLYRIKEMHP